MGLRSTNDSSDIGVSSSPEVLKHYQLKFLYFYRVALFLYAELINQRSGKL